MDKNPNRILVILHAYQPPYPIQEKWVLERIVDNCYRPIMENLEGYPQVKFVLNLNASLSEMLELQHSDILDKINLAAGRGQIEFTNTGAFHPILPMISKEEIILQINQNIEMNKELVGNNFITKGFFPPELAVDTDLMEILAELKYDYVLIPENSIPVDHDKSIPYFEYNGHKLHLITRDKSFSNNISFHKFDHNLDELLNEFFEKSAKRDKPTVIAMDIETFGEHHDEYWKFLFEFLSHPGVEAILPDEYLDHIEKNKVETIIASSWSTDNHELSSNIHFPLWDHPLNSIHTIQHTHLDLLRQAIKDQEIDSLSKEDQKTVLSAYHSCQFWWASKGGRWSPEMIEKGFIIQQQALRIIEKNDHIINLSNKLYERLKFTLSIS